MKKVLTAIISLVLCAVMLVGCSSTTGKNIEVDNSGSSDTWVSFYLVCPECGHKSFTGKEINKGESYEGMAQCDKCEHVFEFSVER